MLAVAFVALTLVTIPPIQTGPCPGYEATPHEACYDVASGTIYVQEPGNKVARWHEIGHAFDMERMDDGERHRFSCLPGAQYEPGWGIRRCGEPWTELQEVFADAFANCALGYKVGSRRFADGFAYEPTTQRRHRNVCRFIQRAAD